MTGNLLLILGFLFTFFIPGICLIETFWKGLPQLHKIPLYILISLILSTHSVYVLSYLFGFGRETILLSFILYTVWFLILLIKRGGTLINVPKEHIPYLAVSIIIFVLFFMALFPAIFTYHNGYIVMAAENWQDTAMHLGIIESISQGNFPPQAPYFSGHPLSYYYFADFHSAILVTLKGTFFPRVLVYDNPFFSALFYLTVYVLAFTLTKQKKVSVLAGIFAVFYGNFMFVRFLSDLYLVEKSTGILNDAINLIASRGYTIDFGELLQVSPMADYFLQNRPMMVGLPAIAAISYLVFDGFKKNRYSSVFLAGVTTALIFKFQLFAFFVSLLIFSICFLVFLKGGIRKPTIKLAFLFTLPVLVSLIYLMTGRVSQYSLIELVRSSFRLGTWDESKDFIWHIKFLFSNFGIIIAGFIVFLFNLIRKERKSEYIFIAATFTVLFFIPYLVKFTIFYGDMFKFYYFSVIFGSLLSSIVFSGLLRHRLLKVFFLLVVIAWISTSTLNLGWSYFNKNKAYDPEDLTTGLWIRQNTPQKSVFLTTPTVHTPVTQIGGRLRVLSYINWPYSHGFNAGDDNVFSRLTNIEKFYGGEISKEEQISILRKYSVDYIYLGIDEKSKNASIEDNLKDSGLYQPVYHAHDVTIYQVSEEI
jgi:hypothetical protein